MKDSIKSIKIKKEEVWILLGKWRGYYNPEILSDGEFFYHFSLFYEILNQMDIVSDWIIQMSKEFESNKKNIAEHWTKLTIHCHSFYHIAWSLLLIFKNIQELKFKMEKCNVCIVRNNILVPHDKDNLVYSTNKAFDPKYGPAFGIKKLKEFRNGKKLIARSNVSAIPLKDIEEFYSELIREISIKINAKSNNATSS